MSATTPTSRAQSGTPSGIAGPKIAHFDRVEWAILPDAATSVGALQRGEIDWLLTPNADLIDSLRKSKGVTVKVNSPTGSISTMRFNQLQPPFDNPAIRRAFFPAIVQSDYMIAMNGDDPTRWRDGVGYFCPGLPMANDAGMQALTGPRSARRGEEGAGAGGLQGRARRAARPGGRAVCEDPRRRHRRPLQAASASTSITR